jgi:Tol biopolymer transport system component
MKRKISILILLVSILLASCATPGDSHLSETAPPDRQPENHQPAHPGNSAIEAPLFGTEIYLVISPPSPPFAFQLVRMPLSCLFDIADNCDVQFLENFPTVGQPSHFQWSPDGKTAIFVNAYTTELLALNAETGHIQEIKTQLPISSGIMTWSPDSQFLALGVQNLDKELSGNIEVVDMDSKNSVLLFKALNDIAYDPVNWLNRHELLVQEYHSGSESPGIKKDTVEKNLRVWHIQDNTWRDLYSGLDLQDSTIAISPDGKQVVFSTVTQDERSLFLLNPQDGQINRLADLEGGTIWSPDGKRIALISDARLQAESPDFNIYLISPGGQELRKVGNIKFMPAHFFYWSSDGKHLLLFLANMEDRGYEYKALLFSLETGEQQELPFPKFLQDYDITDISVRPPGVGP